MRQALRDAILAQGGQAAEGVFRFLFVCFFFASQSERFERCSKICLR